jgi:hypothetical protein
VFYDAVLKPLGIRRFGSGSETALLYGKDLPELVITEPHDGQPASIGNGTTTGFFAPTRTAVHQFHAAAIFFGGVDESPPGPRPLSDFSYGAYVRDPDGHKICAYFFANHLASG